MIAFICGTLEEKNTDSIIVQSGGIGYEILTSAYVLERLPGLQEEVKIVTYLDVKEDSMKLYGFLTSQEKTLFKQLLSVSGVGPKAALAILSVLTPRNLKFTIVGEDEKSITLANGVGPKMARRVILELKDKIDLEATDEETNVAMSSDPMQVDASVREDVLLGLTAMGFSGAEAMSAIAAVADASELDSGDLLKAALKKLAK